MALTAPSPTITSLQRSLRWLWVGPAAGIACMIALITAGVVTQTPGMTIMGASTAALLAALWASLGVSLRRRIAREQQR